MELIKELPEVFEEFAEQRKNSFLGVKKIKRAGSSYCGSILYLFPPGDCNGYGSRHSGTVFHFR